MKMLLRFLRGSKRHFVYAIIFAMISVAASFLSPRIIGYTIDNIIGETVTDSGALVGIAMDIAGKVFASPLFAAVAAVALCALVSNAVN